MKALVLCHARLLKNDLSGHWLQKLFLETQNKYFPNKHLDYETVDITNLYGMIDNTTIHKKHHIADVWSELFIQEHENEYNIVFMPDCTGIWDTEVVKSKDKDISKNLIKIINKTLRLVSPNGILFISRFNKRVKNTIQLHYENAILYTGTDKWKTKYFIIPKPSKTKEETKEETGLISFHNSQIIDRFCKDPNRHTIIDMSPENILFMFQVSKYIIKNKPQKANIRLAKDIINYYNNKRYKCYLNISLCDNINKNKTQPYEGDEFFSLNNCIRNCRNNIQTVFRVREIIRNTLYADYSFTKLNNRKLFPHPPIFTPKTVPAKWGKFPPKMTVDKQKVDKRVLGIIMEHIIKNILNSQRALTVDEIFYITSQFMISRKWVMGNIDYFNDISKWILENLKYKTIEYEPEWGWGSVIGHPDIVTEDTIYDVKMTGAFGKMRSETILQVINYYCLSKLNRLNKRYIGLILPAQKLIVKVDMKGWKWKPVWREMEKAAQMMKQPTNPFEMIIYRSTVAQYVGNTIFKTEGKIYKAINPYKNTHRPVQVFLSSPRGGQIKEGEINIPKALKIINDFGMKVYIHAPYIINLCREEGCKMKEKIKKGKIIPCKYEKWTPALQLKRQLIYGVGMGCKGVVVHIGKKVDMDISIAYGNMLTNVYDAAQEATKDCRLLIETGVGNDILSNVQELANFYNSLDDEIKEVTAICLDTCHVFVAGYMPMDALKILVDNKVPIGLIHFNDAKHLFNSKKDGHAPAGHGFIPLQQLIDVGIWAIENNVSMVYE